MEHVMPNGPRYRLPPTASLRQGTAALIRVAFLGAILGVVALIGPSSAWAGTLVERGDALRVEVLNVPELSREAVVDADGAITLPRLGSIAVAGQDTKAIQEQIAEALDTRGLIQTPVVIVEVTAYRPVYVGGAVGKPGAVEFVPGMTARQAVIAAGGIRLAGTTDGSSDNALAALADRRAVALDFAQTVARIARIEAELAGEPTLEALPEEGNLAGENVVEAILRAEAALLSDRLALRAASRSHGENMQLMAENEIETLERRAVLEVEETEIQSAEVTQARDLVGRGLMPRPQLQELLRDQSRLNRDLLATETAKARARQSAATLQYELANAETQRQAELRTDLQAAQKARVALLAELEKIDLRVLSAGMVRSDGQDEFVPSLVIHRLTGGTARQIAADLDVAVHPGDVLDLSLVPSQRAASNAADRPAEIAAAEDRP
ncbi:polysaccharide biosynthesis/export family protein [Limimaricola variabilis]